VVNKKRTVSHSVSLHEELLSTDGAVRDDEIQVLGHVNAFAGGEEMLGVALETVQLDVVCLEREVEH